MEPPNRGATFFISVGAIITGNVKAAFTNQSINTLFVNDIGVMIGKNGQVWLDPVGNNLRIFAVNPTA